MGAYKRVTSSVLQTSKSREFTESTTMPPCSHNPTFLSGSKSKILHICGSPTDEFTFNLNVFYASSFDTTKNADMDHVWGVIRPMDKKWSFTHDLWSIVDRKSRKIRKDVIAAWLDLPSAIGVLATSIKPVMVLPHLFCFDGITSYRGMLEALQIPIVGSDSRRSFMATNKGITRTIMLECNVPCPPGRVVNHFSHLDFDKFEYPCVVKPTTAENSMGMTLVKSKEGMPEAMSTAFKWSSEVIIDKFIAGRELRCAVIEKVDQFGNVEFHATTPQEYKVRQNDLRTLDDKLLLGEDGLPLDKAPTTVTRFLSKSHEPELFEKIQKLAIHVHKCLEFRDFSMIDLRVDADGNPWVLEVNLFCSFGPKSVLSIHAQETFGWDDGQLFQNMVNNVMRRKT